MHIILLKFADNKSAAPKFMDAHNAWISKGFDDGIFQSVGSLDIGGGFILAHGEEHAAVLQRVSEDPFVKNNIVNPEIRKIDVKRSTPQFSHLSD